MLTSVPKDALDVALQHAPPPRGRSRHRRIGDSPPAAFRGRGSAGVRLLAGITWRFLIVFLLRWWGCALVAVVGIWFLKRDRAGPAGGVFLAVGLVVAIGIAGEVLVTAPHFGRWQTDVVLVLETVEAILLTLAGWRAIAVVSEAQTGESQPPESRSLIGD